MPVIKSNQTPPVLTPFSIRDIEQQAQLLLLRARKAAESLLAEAQREAESMKAVAKTEGFAQGKTDGFQQGLLEGKRSGHDAALAEIKPQLTATWNALTEAVGELEASRHDLQANAIREVVNLSTAIARRVTKLQSTIDPQVMLENVKEAMKLAVHAADVRIVINPDQRAILNQELPKLHLNWPNVKHVDLIDDASVAPGGCRIVSSHGEVDAQIDQQLDRVIADLF